MKTINKVFLAFGLLCLIGVAYATSETVDRVNSVNPQHFLKGLYLGTAASRVATDTANKLATSCAGRIDYVFPELGNDGGSVACAVAPYTVACEGAQVGDPCIAASGFGPTQVLDNHPNAWVTSNFECYVLDAGVVTLRRCGGQSAPALSDAGFNVRVFGNLNL